MQTREKIVEALRGFVYRVDRRDKALKEAWTSQTWSLPQKTHSFYPTKLD
jgi:hypothetical protein